MRKLLIPAAALALLPMLASTPEHPLLTQLQTDAGQGDSAAIYRLALAYETGYQTPGDTLVPDMEKAFELYKQAAEAGHVGAQSYLGFLYATDALGKPDMERALEWMQRAADAGDAKAANNLGYFLTQGQGVKQDFEKAAYWYEKAARAGLPAAMAQLGDLYREGKGVKQDSILALDYYTDAIAGGLPDAQLKLLSHAGPGFKDLPASEALRLGRMYQALGGNTVAAELFAAAADKGSPEALTLLGNAIALANGVSYDAELAMRAYVDAARLGNPSAQYMLAELLELTPDALAAFPEAAGWNAPDLYALAQKGGVSDAREATKALLHSPDFKYWLGVDISGTTADEARGHFTENAEGVPTETTKLMKDLGLNSVRLRVWKDPSATGGFSSPEDVLLMAKRAKEQDMAIMIDFHYSDWWADPGKQNPPKAWEGLSLEQMCDSLADHTRQTLQLLKDNGIEVPWVQVGNETTNGMLWPMAKLPEGIDAYAELTKAGYDAVKEVYPEAQVIVHLDNGFDRELYDRVFDALKERGVKWDIIGMSVYPFWAMDGGKEPDEESTLRHAVSNIRHLKAKYGTDVMIVEVGFDAREPQAGYENLKKIIRDSRDLTGEACLGIWYWAPEVDADAPYHLGAFANKRPTKIMDAYTEAARQASK